MGPLIKKMLLVFCFFSLHFFIKHFSHILQCNLNVTWIITYIYLVLSHWRGKIIIHKKNSHITLFCSGVIPVDFFVTLKHVSKCCYKRTLVPVNFKSYNLFRLHYFFLRVYLFHMLD